MPTYPKPELDLVKEARAFVKSDVRTSRTGSGGPMSKRASLVKRLVEKVERLQQRSEIAEAAIQGVLDNSKICACRNYDHETGKWRFCLHGTCRIAARNHPAD